MAGDTALDRLGEIKHIVVLMMENRSFDHMLGYLKQDGIPEVNGLDLDEFNLGPDGTEVAVTAFDADAHRIQRHGEALQKKLDPDHSEKGVQTQLGMGYGDTSNGGFVKAFVESRDPNDNIGKDLWMVPMGYYTGKDVPVYGHLARNYCVCDAWHSSVPGDTWPNRLYAVAGREGARVTPAAGLALSTPCRGAPDLRRQGLHAPTARPPVALVLARPRNAARRRQPLPRSARHQARQLHLL